VMLEKGRNAIEIEWDYPAKKTNRVIAHIVDR